MKINIDQKADTPYGTFKVSFERSDVILDHLAAICEKAVLAFPDDYSIYGVVKQPDGISAMMRRIDTGRMLAEMLEVAETEDEKNYILYIAYTGIERVHFLIFKEPA